MHSLRKKIDDFFKPHAVVCILVLLCVLLRLQVNFYFLPRVSGCYSCCMRIVPLSGWLFLRDVRRSRLLVDLHCSLFQNPRNNRKTVVICPIALKLSSHGRASSASCCSHLLNSKQQLTFENTPTARTPLVQDCSTKDFSSGGDSFSMLKLCMLISYIKLT